MVKLGFELTLVTTILYSYGKFFSVRILEYSSLKEAERSGCPWIPRAFWALPYRPLREEQDGAPSGQGSNGASKPAHVRGSVSLLVIHTQFNLK